VSAKKLYSCFLPFPSFRTGAAGLDLFERSAASGELLLDGLDSCSPYEWFGTFIPGSEESRNGVLQIFNAEEHA
jgi:hypothetical protein